MKKNFNLVIIFTVISIHVLSCGTTKNVFDESIPAENSVTIKLEPSIKVKSYNGIDTKLKTAMGWTGFTIPVGDASFLVDLEVVGSSNAITGSKTIYNIDNVEFSYKFEHGKEYFIRCWYTDENGKVPVSNIGTGLKMSLIICEGGFYNAVYIKKL